MIRPTVAVSAVEAVVMVTDILKTRFPNLTTTETAQISGQIVTAMIQAFKLDKETA